MMAKRFKFRLSRVIPSFHSCRSKDPSTLPEDPVPSFLRLPPAKSKLMPASTLPPPGPPSSKTQLHCSSFRRHVSSAISCGFWSIQRRSDDDHDDSPDFKWQKEEKWHVVAKVYDKAPGRKIYNSAASGDSDDHILARSPPPQPPLMKRRGKKKNATTRVRLSTSSADSGWFSSEGGNEIQDEEIETLVSSSHSLSTDSSSEFNPQLETIREAPISRRHKKSNKKKAKRTNRGLSKAKNICRLSVSSPECVSPARLSVFQKLIPCTVDGKVKESFAVVKKSKDPYEDFKRSMMEMILEKQMFEKDDLEQLLQCFLSLNSRHHHGVIVEAFSDIWATMFCTSTRACRPSTSRHRLVSKAL